MSITFTKLFSSITASTVWCEDPETKIVWITMLAMADKNGRVWGSIPGIAGIARVTVEGCRTAIGKFLGPDPDSRTKEHEGRRIEPIDGGWRLLNYDKYRSLRDEEERKEYKREWIKNKRNVDKNVDNVDKSRPQYTNAEAEAEADSINKKEEKKERTRFAPPTLDQVNQYMTERKRPDQAQKFFLHYESNGWRVGKNPMKKWEAAAAQWLSRDFDSGHSGKSAQPIYTGWNEHRDLIVGPPARQRVYDDAKASGMNFESQEQFDVHCSEVLRKMRA